MHVLIQNISTTVQKCSASEDQWIRTVLTQTRAIRGFRGIKKGVEELTLYDSISRSFPSGVLPELMTRAKTDNITITFEDLRTKPCNPKEVNLFFLADDKRGPYQKEAIEAGIQWGRGIFWCPTGWGKCLGKNTPVLLYDGTILPVEEIIPGMELMGPDSTPRKVLSCNQGIGPLYRITPNKGEPWVCNDAHILTLINTQTDQIIDISVTDYLQRSKAFQHVYKQFSVGVSFPEQHPLPVDPYFLGVWYGDGTKLNKGIRISNTAPAIKDLCESIAAQWGLSCRITETKDKCPIYRLVQKQQGEGNSLLQILKQISSPHYLPKQYLTASRKDRLQLLAGLLDADGYLHLNSCFEILQKEKQLAKNIVFLANSTGLRATFTKKRVKCRTYYRVLIGGDTSIIPTRFAQKKAIATNTQKDAKRVGFSITSIGEGEYFGFTLDGDGRFLLGDCTVTHNTNLAIGLVKKLPCKWAFIVDEASLVGQSMDRWNAWDFDDEPAGILGDGRWQDARFVVATYQSIRERIHEPEIKAWVDSVEGILLDECHTCSAKTYYDTAMSFTNAYHRFGLSATPLSRTPWDNLRVMATTGRVIYKANVPEMVAAGVLAMPIVHMKEFQHKESLSPTYQGVYGDLIVSNTKRNKEIVEVTKTAEKPALVFVKQINHGEDLLERSLKAGIKAEFLYAEASLKERKLAINRLAAGEVEVIITNKIFQKGVDIPTVKTIVIAASGKSIIDSLQRVGRGMRTAEGKDMVTVYDWMDRGNDWLLAHSRERKKAYVAAGYLMADNLQGKLLNK